MDVYQNYARALLTINGDKRFMPLAEAKRIEAGWDSVTAAPRATSKPTTWRTAKKTTRRTAKKQAPKQDGLLAFRVAEEYEAHKSAKADAEADIAEAKAMGLTPQQAEVAALQRKLSAINSELERVNAATADDVMLTEAIARARGQKVPTKRTPTAATGAAAKWPHLAEFARLSGKERTRYHRENAAALVREMREQQAEKAPLPQEQITLSNGATYRRVKLA